MTESTPTPNDMPGAPKPEPSKVDDQKTEAEPKKASTAEPVLSAEDAAELSRLRKIHADESKWEKRAKQNFEDAEKLRALMKSLGGEENTEFDPKAEFDKLRAEIESERTERIRAEIARAEKVDPEFVIGATEEEMRASAQRYREAVDAAIQEALKTNKSPSAPPASTVTSDGKIGGPEQITSRDELAKLPPAERLKAYQEGRLDRLMGKS